MAKGQYQGSRHLRNKPENTTGCCKLSLFLDKTKFIKSNMLSKMIHSAHITISYRSINRFVIRDPGSDFSGNNPQ